MSLVPHWAWRRRRPAFFTLLAILAFLLVGAQFGIGPLAAKPTLEQRIERILKRELRKAEAPRDCFDPDDADAVKEEGRPRCPPDRSLPKGCPLPPSDLRRNLDLRPVTFCDADGFDEPDSKDKGCTVPMKKTRHCDAADVKSWYVLRSSAGIIPHSIPYGCPHQMFAGFSGESEAYYPRFLAGKENGIWNISVDYRYSSDVPVTYFDPPLYNLRAPPLPYTEKRKREQLATAFVSNCASHNDREKWLEDMDRLIKVASYGQCKRNAEVDEDIAKEFASNRWRLKIEASRRFLFQLVFENSDETDYVTEKLYQALEAGTVPIYMGAKGQIWRHLPNRSSIIYVADFKGPEELAAHVLKVAANETLYNSYLEWRNYPFSKEWKELERISYVGWRCRTAHLVSGVPYRWRGAFDNQPDGVYEYGASEKLKATGESAEGSGWADPWLDGLEGWKSLRREAWIDRKREEIRKRLIEGQKVTKEQLKESAPLVTGAMVAALFIAAVVGVTVGLAIYRTFAKRRQRSAGGRGRASGTGSSRQRGRSMSPPFSLPIAIGPGESDNLLPRLPAP